jgi:oligopeptide/dipeptide ABC transporter ATP-binding protein
MKQPNPLLSVKDLTKLYPIKSNFFSKVTGHVHAVGGVSFDISPHEVLGLAGESGSGKTTIGRSVLRLVEPTSGSIRFDGRDVLALNARELRAFRRDAQIIFQDPFASLDPKMTIEQTLSEPLQLHGLANDRNERRTTIAALLDLVGLTPDFMDRSPQALSGGQRQRIGIARALAVKPSLIVADEPVSALDVSVQAQVVNLLCDLRSRLGLAMLFISHDLAVMQHFSDRIAVLYLGRVMEIGPAKQLCLNPRHPYTEALLSAVPDPDPARRRSRIVLRGDIPSPADPPSGCVFRTRCHMASAECAMVVPELREVAPGQQAACIKV